ncbi:MAG: hypothetical protein M1140_01950 [Chloroflexi bacterium]|nr:hypothetical protein [Chloroflexota bacterium]
MNVYDVHIAVAGNYYTGTTDTVLAVYDLSLGFTTGGGTITRNGVLANFGFNVKYLSNGKVQGNVLYIEHRAIGDVMLKSNAMGSLSIVKTVTRVIRLSSWGRPRSAAWATTASRSYLLIMASQGRTTSSACG